MVSYSQITVGRDGDIRVLILIVVEDGLVLDKVNAELKKLDVLILIVVEDGLVQDFELVPQKFINVLILIVVEDGLVHGVITGHYEECGS